MANNSLAALEMLSTEKEMTENINNFNDKAIEKFSVQRKKNGFYVEINL